MLSHSAARFPSILSGFMLCVVWSSLNRRLFFFYGLKNLSSHMRRGTFNGPVSALGVDFHAECLGLERERERELERVPVSSFQANDGGPGPATPFPAPIKRLSEVIRPLDEWSGRFL